MVGITRSTVIFGTGDGCFSVVPLACSSSCVHAQVFGTCFFEVCGFVVNKGQIP